MSIFIDPSVEYKIFPTTTVTKQIPRNTCGPATTECAECATLPYLQTDECIDTKSGGCIVITTTGIKPTTDSSSCSPVQLQGQNADTNYINALANENLNLGGATACVFKMLGVQQQGTLIDAAGAGCPIASDFLTDYPPGNAYDRFALFWSTQTSGQGVLKSWIGYDFGMVMRASGLQRYSNEADAEARRHITTIAIKQTGTAANWVSKIRIERSDDGIRWRGVDVLTLPQTDQRVQLAVKQSVPSRMWRIVPITTIGTDHWQIDTLEMFEFIETDLYNTQDSPLFQENRDRSYCVNPVKLKIFYDLINISTELSRFGIDLPTATMTLTANFSEAVKQLGRGFVIGDIIEIPSEVQFTADLKAVRKFVEVSDVNWSTKGYTPGWVPLFQQVTAKPMLARQEVMDIIGSLEADLGETGLGYGSRNVIFSDMALQASEQIQIAADTMVPQLGQDEQYIADSSEISDEYKVIAKDHHIDISKLVTNYSNFEYNRDGGSQRSAMPPAGTKPEMFSTGDHSVGFPKDPVNGQYHRMSYDSIITEQIPPKLFRYSLAKNRWIFLESDDRYKMQTNKTLLKTYLVDEHKINLKDAK